MGVNRLVATLVIIGAVVLAFVFLMLLFVPILGGPARRLHREPARLRVAAAVAGGDPNRVAAQASSARASPRRAGRRSGQAGRRLADDLREVAVVRRTGADLGLLARGRDAGGRVLPALRLGPDARDGRQLGPAAASRDRARARARDRRGDRRLRARADGGLPDPRLVLRGRADADRAQFRSADRAGVRAHHVHSLYRLDDRPGAGGRRRGRAVLAGATA